MRAGELRKYVTIQEKTGETRDSYGSLTWTWQTLQQVYAAIEPLSGREFFDAQEVQADVSVRIRIRALAGVKPDMRVVYGSRVLEILSVLDLEERGQEMHLMCREVIE